MRGGFAGPMALAAGLILSLFPAMEPPPARPGGIPPAQSAYTDAAYAHPASTWRAPVATVEVPAPGAPLAVNSPPAPRPTSLDVLFVGAHPDDESGDLSTFGQWNEQRHVRTGVLTITR